MKKALVLNGSCNEIPLIEAAHRQGYYVITTGNNPSLVGHKYADEYRCADYSDKDAVCTLAHELKVDIVVPCANDFGVISAAYTAEKLGLGGHDTYKTALILQEKNRFKAFGKEHGFAIIPSEGFTDPEAALAYIREYPNYPLMVKPADLSGGKGMTKVNSYPEAEKAVRFAFSKTKRNTVVVEPFITGPNLAYEALIVGEKIAMDVCLQDCTFQNPFLVSHSYGHCGFFTEELRLQMKSEIERLAGILHLADGMWCLQFVLHDGKPYYIETMRRCLGNFPIKADSYITGYDWYDFMLKAYASRPKSDYHLPDSYSRTERYAGYVCFMPPHNGRVKQLWVDPEFGKHIFFRIMLEGPGYEVTNYKEEKLGYAVYGFDSWEEMDGYCSHIYDYVHTDIE